MYVKIVDQRCNNYLEILLTSMNCRLFKCINSFIHTKIPIQTINIYLLV